MLRLGLCYFPFISWLGAPYDENNGRSKEEEFRQNKEEKGTIDHTQPPAGFDNQDLSPTLEQVVEKSSHHQSPADEVEKMMSALAIAMITAALAESISHTLHVPSLSVPISTVLAVTLATLFPQQLNPLTGQGELLGKLLILLFFASIGNASGTIASTFAATGAVYLLCFGMILYAVHLAVILGIGKMIGIPLPDLLMASNANIGNIPTNTSICSTLASLLSSSHAISLIHLITIPLQAMLLLRVPWPPQKDGKVDYYREFLLAPWGMLLEPSVVCF